MVCHGGRREAWRVASWVPSMVVRRRGPVAGGGMVASLCRRVDSVMAYGVVRREDGVVSAGQAR